jgi:transposase
MLDEKTRSTILALQAAGHGKRAIARILGISRNAAKQVIATGTSAVPALDRAEKAEPYHDELVRLVHECKGHLVRVHEELEAQGAQLSYQALTSYCRRHGIGHEPKQPAGRYDHQPGQEMQHDTSPHPAHVGGRERPVQIAGLALAHSNLAFVQLYPQFTRFECKVFLDDALDYVGGACHVCMIDNTSVIVLRGTGADMVPVPEMAAFAERYGFTFRAHEKGDANRSARVERPFSFIENNFLAGRVFADWADLNRQALAWCEKVNANPKRHLKASPRELFAAEQPHLRPLPAWVPPVYALHQRIVDLEGYVSVHTNRYSVPARWIGRRIEVRETKDEVQIYDGPRLVATHLRVLEPLGRRVTCPEHRPPRGQGLRQRGPSPEEAAVLTTAPELTDFVIALKKRASGRAIRELRHLQQMVHDYPRPALRDAVATALHYGLFDLDRIETLVLRRVRDDFFPHPYPDSHD